MRKLSVYVHIPFCVKKCRYCDFLSFQATQEKQRAYVEALLLEIKQEAVRYAGYMVDTVFIGGGTPSILLPEMLEEILDVLRASFSFAKQTEITIEVNPGTVNEAKLTRYKSAGINRLSIGTQSVHDRELAYLGRIHRAKDFFETYQAARKAGFENINVDVMAALPGQSVEDYMDNLRQIVELEPEHISAYSLIIEDGTDFYELYGQGAEVRADIPSLPSEEDERKMYEDTESFLEKKGYYRYEISNYSKKNRECMHNLAYWTRKDYVGFGIGAASMVENVRWKNLADIDQYIRDMKPGTKTDGGMKTETSEAAIKEEVCVLSREEQMEEFMFLGLRLTVGVSRTEFADTFGRGMDEIYGTVLEKLTKQNLIENGEYIRLTPYGRDISNYVMAEFLFDK